MNFEKSCVTKIPAIMFINVFQFVKYTANEDFTLIQIKGRIN